MASSSQSLSGCVYLDPSRSVTERVNDLLHLMTLPEKAGLLFHNMIAQTPSLETSNAHFSIPSAHEYVTKMQMNHFNLIGPITDPLQTATWYNSLQELALKETRLGIPVTLSTDPRNHFSDNPGAAFSAGCLSQWPEPLGLAALRSSDLVERFADIARQEYLALGFRVALHPQVDLATEPRWARIAAAFGEDAELSSQLVSAYIRGFQGPKSHFGKDSVSCMTKHFPGGGPQMDGEDPHFHYGREQVYPGKEFDYHIKPFRAAIEAGTRQIMPYYGMPVGEEVKERGWEEVGFALNKPVITGELRDKLGFEGIICTDWGIVSDSEILGQKMPARAWGAEHLSEIERVVKILQAGCDMFGGEARPELVVSAVEKGLIDEQRLDQCVKRILKEKFELGLFDDRRFVDAQDATKVVGRRDWKIEGENAQRRAYTLLKNQGDMLPLKDNTKIYVEGVERSVLESRGFEAVSEVEEADVALLRLKAPFEPRPGGFEQFFHAGSLEYSAEEKARQAKIYKAVPTVVDLYLDRPACIPEIAEHAAALLVSYGSNADALLDVLLGKWKPEGKLPFDLPRSMEAVRASRSDAPFDSKDPVYRFGDGLSYR